MTLRHQTTAAVMDAMRGIALYAPLTITCRL